MRSAIFAILMLSVIGATPAFAVERLVNYVPDAKPVGAARFSVFMIDVYDAVLLAPAGVWRQDSPFALQLTYLRALKGKNIADRSVEEMRKIGITDEVKLAAWHTQMRQIFPDVDDGVSLTGIRGPQGESIFFHGNQEIGRIKDPDFGRAFFGIWLDEKTSAPELRQKLLGAL